MALLSFENISIGYDNNPIVENLNFEVEQGDYLTVLGENGAGKSTLLKTMLGLMKPLSGKIVFDKKVKKGVTYTYKVRAIVKVGKKNYKGKCTAEKSISR